MANAGLDQNSRQTLTALSNANDGSIVTLWADPTTHRLLVDTAAGSGTVASVSVVTANGISGTVATATTTPAITLTLGAITPTSTNGVSAATMAFMDATSSVQTQLNGKQASLGYTAENVANKDATGGYAGLTLFKMNFKNALNTITSFFTNANTIARTYTFQDRDGTIADNTDLALKAPIASPVFTTNITTPAIVLGATTLTPTGTELNYVAGVTSAIQTQMNLKAPLASPTFTGTVTLPSGQALVAPALGTPASGVATNLTGLPAAAVVAGSLGTGAYVMDTKLTVPSLITTSNAITASANAATVPITSRISTVTNNSAALLTITITTTGAVDGQLIQVRVLDFSAVAQTITWVNTQNGEGTAPTTSNGSTTLPRAALFQYNAGSSLWRCIAA